MYVTRENDKNMIVIPLKGMEDDQRGGEEKEEEIKSTTHRLAIPLKVLILRSVYPSASSKVPLVCIIVSLCADRSASVFRPISSVSNAIR